jgi:hypothetical protein
MRDKYLYLLPLDSPLPTLPFFLPFFLPTGFPPLSAPTLLRNSQSIGNLLMNFIFDKVGDYIKYKRSARLQTFPIASHNNRILYTTFAVEMRK